ncbi:hypothetical protein F5Y17DRAFT_475081 [Xylariaceae sp. FL0594]|nr:hypothetical protein F5Y17DRAFT_475081 [Xylariaceae sp. FL0594]
MPLNGSLEKDSLYINLNSRPIPGEYHWGLILTDSHTGPPVLHHASNRNGPWRYEVKQFDLDDLALVALLRVDKVDSPSRAREDALAALHEQGINALPTDMDTLESQAKKHGLECAPGAEVGEGAKVINDPFSNH